MSKEIVKYTVHYTVQFKKDLWFEPVQIWEDAFKSIGQSLKTTEFVKIGWVLHSKYNILYIKPFEISDEMMWLLKNEDKRIVSKVKGYMKNDTETLTSGRLKVMIEKAKEYFNC